MNVKKGTWGCNLRIKKKYKDIESYEDEKVILGNYKKAYWNFKYSEK